MAAMPAAPPADTTGSAAPGPWLSAAGLRHVPQRALLPFSCKRRGFCLSCAGSADGPDGRIPRRVRHPLGADAPMGRGGAHPLALLNRIITEPRRQRPIRLFVLRSTRYYVNQAVKGGVERLNVHAECVTFIQRFGSALNLISISTSSSLKGVSWIAPRPGLEPRFVKVEPPADTDITAVVQKSVGASSAHCATWDTWRREKWKPCPRGMIRCVTTPPSWLVLWRPRCSSASLGERAGQKVRPWRRRRDAKAHGLPLCEHAAFFLARQHPGPGPIGATSWSA